MTINAFGEKSSGEKKKHMHTEGTRMCSEERKTKEGESV